MILAYVSMYVEQQVNTGNQTDQSDLRICDSYDLIEIAKHILPTTFRVFVG